MKKLLLLLTTYSLLLTTNLCSAQMHTATAPARDSQSYRYIAITGGAGLPVFKFNAPGPAGNSNDYFNDGGHGEALNGINFNIELAIPLSKPTIMFMCKLGYHSNPFDMASYTSVPMHDASPDLPGSAVGGPHLLSESAGKYSAFDLMGGLGFSTKGKCSFNFNFLTGVAWCTFPNIDYSYSIHYSNTQDTTGSVKVRTQPAVGLAFQMGCGLRYFITPKISILGNLDIFYCLVGFSFQVDRTGDNALNVNYAGSTTYADNYSLFNATLGLAYAIGK